MFYQKRIKPTLFIDFLLFETNWINQGFVRFHGELRLLCPKIIQDKIQAMSKKDIMKS